MSLDSEIVPDIGRDILQHVSDGVVLCDDELTVTYLNKAAIALLGAADTQPHGCPLSELPSGGALLADQVRRLDGTGTEIQFEEPDADIAGTVRQLEDGTLLLLERSTEQGETTGSDDTVLQELHDIASDLDLSREEKITQMLSVTTDHLGVEYGFITRIQDDTQEILYSVGDHPQLADGVTAPLSETYCQYTLEDGETNTITTPTGDSAESEAAYERFGFHCYLGVVLSVDDEEYGTVCFADDEPLKNGFGEHAQTVGEMLGDWLTLMLERQTYEQELEQQQAFIESQLNSLPDIVYAFDVDGQPIQWNDSLETVTGYDTEEVAQMKPTDFVIESDTELITNSIDAVLTDQSHSVETTLETKDDTRIPYEFANAPLYDEVGEIVGVTGVGRDITEQATQQERLSGILNTTRSLMQARDRQHVGELAASAATELLDEEIAVFRLYDSDAGTLEAIASSEGGQGVIGERPTYDVGEGYPGTVFGSGEPTIVSDLTDAENEFEYGDARSAMYYPVGVHGTITVASTEPGAFDEMDQDVLGLLATSAAAACMRAKRMQEVREAREQSDRLIERVNGLVENTVEVLVQARTRDELESSVVSELATTDPYAYAWVGQPDVTSQELVPTAWEGDASLPIQARSFDLSNETEPVARAYHERETQVLTEMDEVYGPLSDIIARSDIEAILLIPIVYKDATYGVLSVCARDSAVFDERERIILDALGQAVANAINAVERGRILDATEIIELEFAVDSPDLLFNRLAASTDSRVEVVGTDYRSDGAVRLYLSAEDVDPAELSERAKTDQEIIETTAIVEHEDECLLELVVEESLLAMLAEYGAVTREVVADGAGARFTVELSAEAEARELFELVEQRYPGTDLLGYHERERAVETRQDFKAALSDRLTDRQETALRTAYLGGFFDWPREIDGNELAEAMDIARPTYHQHLRAAQGKVFEELFD
ncbi:bacterio-opsin activator domain-containing protein [Halovenus rubra]|uniref:Bacterio-opsin activator domain-containing protein n=2 Tax=Halovenus rubra TaxID=869890 RepID=A0ABD5X5B5_9EURY|nr:bacterio-opsin activator domain-containing protein [Halovenus rubra]